LFIIGVFYLDTVKVYGAFTTPYHRFGSSIGSSRSNYVIFRKDHSAVVLGYIIARFLVGPHGSLIPTVVDSEGIKIWSEIGLIFLLFSLGLKLSFSLFLGAILSISSTTIIMRALDELGVRTKNFATLVLGTDCARPGGNSIVSDVVHVCGPLYTEN
jgi:Kef-type K+ transport system membrane component KefB